MKQVKCSKDLLDTVNKLLSFRYGNEERGEHFVNLKITLLGHLIVKVNNNQL